MATLEQVARNIGDAKLTKTGWVVQAYPSLAGLNRHERIFFENLYPYLVLRLLAGNRNNHAADEVFTPPKLASAMLDLLPQDLFHRADSTFLDPMCKSGVFLREIARRLNEGLRDQMPGEQARVEHILTKQVFGLATSELTAAICRRSVYCSKKADGKYSIATKFATFEGNIRLPRTQHRWNRDGRCGDCGATSAWSYLRGGSPEAWA